MRTVSTLMTMTTTAGELAEILANDDGTYMVRVTRPNGTIETRTLSAWDALRLTFAWMVEPGEIVFV